MLSRDLAPEPRTLLDILRETTALHPDASALDDGSGALSYRELMARVVATAARLQAAGVAVLSPFAGTGAGGLNRACR